MAHTLPRTLGRLAPTLAAGCGGLALGWVIGFEASARSSNPFPNGDLRAPTPEAKYDIRYPQAPGSYQFREAEPLGSLVRMRGEVRDGRGMSTTRDASDTWVEHVTVDGDGIVRVRELEIKTMPAIFEVVMDERGIVREFGAVQLVPLGDANAGFSERRIGYRSVRNTSGYEDPTESGYYDKGLLQR